MYMEINEMSIGTFGANFSDFLGAADFNSLMSPHGSGCCSTHLVHHYDKEGNPFLST